METRVRELLRDLADEAPVELRMPPRLRSWVRRRRAVAASMAVVVVAGLGAGAYSGIRAFGGRQPEPSFRPAGVLDSVPLVPGQEDWRGLWPNVTEQAGRRAQEHPGFPELLDEWRLDAAETARRYVRDVFDWPSVHLLRIEGDIDGAGPVGVLVSPCPSISACAGGVPVEVVLERLLLPDPSGVWFVTDLGLPEGPQVDESLVNDLASRAEEQLLRMRATAVVSLFLQSRAAGSGAEAYLTPSALAAYREHRGGLYLYGSLVESEPHIGGTPDGHPDYVYCGFDLRSGPTPADDGTFTAHVGINAGLVETPCQEPDIDLVERLVVGGADGFVLVLSAEFVEAQTATAAITAPEGAALSGFDRAVIELPANREVSIRFENLDREIPHTVSIYLEAGPFSTPDSAPILFRGRIITGPDTAYYTFRSPEPGAYYFQCDVHPTTMNGTVVVR